MAKIKVTESELKEVIRESVENVISENSRYNYGMNWNDLTEPEKQAFAAHYAKSPFHKNGLWTGANDLASAEKVYNRKQARKARKGKLSYSADQYNRLQTDAATDKTSLEKIYGKLGVTDSANAQLAIDNLIKERDSLKSQVPGLQAKIEQLTKANQSLTKTNQSLMAQSKQQAAQNQTPATGMQNSQNKIAPISNPALTAQATTATQPTLAGQKPGTARA